MKTSLNRLKKNRITKSKKIMIIAHIACGAVLLTIYIPYSITKTLVNQVFKQ